MFWQVILAGLTFTLRAWVQVLQFCFGILADSVNAEAVSLSVTVLPVTTDGSIDVLDGFLV